MQDVQIPSAKSSDDGWPGEWIPATEHQHD
jgi:hypothetical protein